MELIMLNRKRPRLWGCEREPSPCRKKYLTLSEYRQNLCPGGAAALGTLRAGTGTHSFIPEPPTLRDSNSLSQHLSLWSDTQRSVDKVLQHLERQAAPEDIFLDEQVNDKFVQFHRDITEECGTEDKQHSWAVMEKREEIVMYGPYFPNYLNGEHSEDTIIKQTQELLEAGDPSPGCEVFVFTVNSPCLARNVSACMINLVRKAQEWWSQYGVKTHIGFLRCWGFKGNKETLFRDVDHGQVELLSRTENRQDYVRAADARTDLKPLCGNLSCAMKRLLTSVSLTFSLGNVVQEQDWKTYFKKVHDIGEGKPEDEKEELIQKINATVEAAHEILDKSGSLDEHLESGNSFPFDETLVFSDASDSLRREMTPMFQRCWGEMVRDKYAEIVRARLAEVFNQCVIHFFIDDISKCSSHFLQIGRVRFSKEEPEGRGDVR